MEKAKNVKLLLCAFKQLSRLKINFHTIEIFCFGNTKNSEIFFLNYSGARLERTCLNI
jgi:hypothetical protein